LTDIKLISTIYNYIFRAFFFHKYHKKNILKYFFYRNFFIKAFLFNLFTFKNSGRKKIGRFKRNLVRRRIIFQDTFVPYEYTTEFPLKSIRTKSLLKNTLQDKLIKKIFKIKQKKKFLHDYSVKTASKFENFNQYYVKMIKNFYQIQTIKDKKNKKIYIIKNKIIKKLKKKGKK